MAGCLPEGGQDGSQTLGDARSSPSRGELESWRVGELESQTPGAAREEQPQVQGWGAQPGGLPGRASSYSAMLQARSQEVDICKRLSASGRANFFFAFL